MENQEATTMYLKDQKSGDLVEVLDVLALMDPNKMEITGRFHSGEEIQDPQAFAKTSLCFPSNETLPLCWMQADYPR